MTSTTTVEIARRISVGHVIAGFRTLSATFDADFITSFEGITRSDW